MVIRRKMSWPSALIFVLLLGLSACKPKETELPFEILEQRERIDTSEGYNYRESFLAIVTRVEEISSLDEWISEQSQVQLQTLDYESYFALVIFQGRKGTDGYSIQVERISRVKDEVTVSVHIQEPHPDQKKNDIVTSPYCLVQVQKTGTWDRDITFNVIAGGNVIFSASHSIPQGRPK